ncbi:hypothetical protein YA0697_06815 [Pseudomonas viridiflava]|uniref:hypothetical protein n=1 Tax=Pseudomonas viridiflava TaxID=33069 RepID=UPI0018E5E0CC|nr:hypothetical protein [Pseudomonas viridiflava]MBI6681423.1 hypothetical protein [Pseudomonas viridiflava]
MLHNVNIQEVLAADALLARLAREDSSGSDCLYAQQPTHLPILEQNEFLVCHSPASEPDPLSFIHVGELSHSIVQDRRGYFYQPFIQRARVNLPALRIYDHHIQRRWIEGSSDQTIRTSAVIIIGAQIHGMSNLPNYEMAYARLRDFENEEYDWDDLGGYSAHSSTATAVSESLTLARELGISRPSLTLSNSGAVSVIWNNDSAFVTLKFKGDNQYSVVILVERKPQLTINCPVGQLPEELEQFLIENFREDVTANLPELQKNLR